MSDIVERLRAVLAATPAVGGEREALQAALAFIDTALVADENPTMSKREVVRIIREALAGQPTSPAVGGESPSDADWERAVDCAFLCLRNVHGFLLRYELDNAMQHAFGILALAQPASPLRGREITDAMLFVCDEAVCHKDPMFYEIFAMDDRWDIIRAILKTASAAPPEQPAADPVTGREG